MQSVRYIADVDTVMESLRGLGDSEIGILKQTYLTDKCTYLVRKQPNITLRAEQEKHPDRLPLILSRPLGKQPTYNKHGKDQSTIL